MAKLTDEHHDWVANTLNVDPRSYAAAPGRGDAGRLSRHPEVQGGRQAREDAQENTDKAMLAQYLAAVKRKDWTAAAMSLNFFEEAIRRVALAKLAPDVVALLHKAAIADADMGQNSPVALATAALVRPVVGGAQADRAGELEKKLSPADAKAYHDLLDATKAPKEKQYITKGLAAGHSVAELQAFAAKIAGKDDTWMQDNLALTGDSNGKGVKQQWSMSCNATTEQAVRGEMDPLYALKMHEDNPNLSRVDDADGAKLNPTLAADQKAQLESTQADGTAGGLARNRGDKTQVPGRWNTDLLNNVKATTGLTYARQPVTPATMDQSITDINGAVDKQMPVPIVVGDGGANPNAHYVLITASDPGPPRYYSIHDPDSGETSVWSEDQIRKGNLNLGGGWNKLSQIEKPTPVKVTGTGP